MPIMATALSISRQENLHHAIADPRGLHDPPESVPPRVHRLPLVNDLVLGATKIIC